MILSAYVDVPEEERLLLKIRPYGIRAMVTSLVFKKTCALSDVMTTFASHYLGDCTHRYMVISSLGPIVAGQQVVPAEKDNPQMSQN